jgi:hypothetical protein
MALIADIMELARLLETKPELVEIIANARPKEYEEVQRLIATPFFQWKPYGWYLGQSWGGYEPHRRNPCQVGFLADPSHNKWAICGNRTGKTETGDYEDTCDCVGIDPLTGGRSKRFFEPIRMFVISDTEETSVQVVERMMVDRVLGWDEQGYLWNFVDDDCQFNDRTGWTGHTLKWTTGSIQTFKFSTQRRNTFQGVKLHKARMDEVQPQDIYSETIARLIDFNGYFSGTMTPIYDKTHGIPWIYEELYLKRDAKRLSFHNWSLDDNPHIPVEAKQRLMQEWDEDEIEARAFGMFVPIGVKLALPTTLMRQVRATIKDAIHGQLAMTETEEVSFYTTEELKGEDPIADPFAGSPIWANAPAVTTKTFPINGVKHTVGDVECGTCEHPPSNCPICEGLIHSERVTDNEEWTPHLLEVCDLCGYEAQEGGRAR